MKQNGMYWMMFSGNIKRVLINRYGKEYTKAIMPKIKQQYNTLLEQFPDVGKHTLTDMVYMGVVFLALWLGTDKMFSTEELTEINTEILRRLKYFFGIVNLNKSWAKKKLNRETKHTWNGLRKKAQTIQVNGKGILIVKLIIREYITYSQNAPYTISAKNMAIWKRYLRCVLKTIQCMT